MKKERSENCKNCKKSIELSRRSNAIYCKVCGTAAIRGTLKNRAKKLMELRKNGSN